MKPAPQTLAEALDVIRTMHGALLDFRHPEFDLIAPGREGEFDDRVKAVLAHSAPVINADRQAGIDLGDTVRLNSGGPDMVVEVISVGTDGRYCQCTWPNDEGEARTGAFPLASVTLVRKGARATLPEVSPATKGQCNDERACGACFSGQGQCETAKPAPSVSPADVEAQITHTFYANLGDAENAAWPDPNARDEFHPALNMITTCTLVTKNGHSVVGVAYCADPAKFNAQTGRDSARADAIRQLWPMVIYAERERLAALPSIQLTPAEVQSGVDRVRWAELLIEQLPADHDGRNSWLLNYGRAAAGGAL